MKHLIPKMIIPSPKLNRYTTLPIALDMLARKRITLLSPDTWEDRNDAYFLERYQQELKFRSVVAICFSMTSETFHHWRIFSHGVSGVCIEFDKRQLLRAIDGMAGFSRRQVIYRYIWKPGADRPDIELWPFLKRKPFEAEAEFRIIYETKKESVRLKHVSIDLSAIRKVTLSPWLSESVAESVIALIKSIDGCEHLNVNRSSLIDNAAWRGLID